MDDLEWKGVPVIGLTGREEELLKLVKEIIDKSKELEEQGIDIDSWNGWGPYRERLNKLEGTDIKLAGVYRIHVEKPKPDPQKKMDEYIVP